MRKLIDYYYRFLQVVLTLLIAVLIVPVAMQILSRYVGFVPRYIWTEEIARFCFVWMIMIGAMMRRARRHPLRRRRNARAVPIRGSRRIEARIFVHLSILAFAAIVFVGYGWTFIEFGSVRSTSARSPNCP
jgi:TRAP-type transport system small permease protein